MATQIIYPAPAKLNLFLHIVGRRADGYHELQAVFTMVDYLDTMTIELREDGQIRRTSTLEGVPADDDLVVRAAHLLQRETGCGLGCDIHVEKRIPLGAGLGGGSSDAATTLLALNDIWGLRLSDSQLRDLGLVLGADVPFFVFGRTAFGEGVGEVLHEFDLPQWWYLVLTPPAKVSTAAVFGAKDLTRDTIPIKIADFSVNGLRAVKNDLQPVVLKAFPVVAEYLQALAAVSQKSVFGARMTGSGSSVFAAFDNELDARAARKALSPEYKGFIAKGLHNHPLE